MIKNAIILLCLVCVAATAHSQADLLQKNENSFFVEGGISGQDEVDFYSLGAGLTFFGRLDVGASVGRIIDIPFGQLFLGQILSFNFVKESLGSSTVNLSFNQSFGYNQDISTLSVGGSFSHKFKFSASNAVLYSIGYSRVKNLGSHLSSIDTFPFEITLAIRGKQNYIYLSPFISYATNNNTVYGVSIGFSLVRNGEK